MKIIVHSLVIIVGAAIGLVVGFALRDKHPLPTAKAGTPTTHWRYGGPNAKSDMPAKGGTPRSAQVNDDSPLATKLERDLSMSSGVTRWLHWVDALEKAMPTDFPRLFQLTKG